ncbi:MAG: carboxyl transferase domain-containing protein [Planctomycetota bacterium]
MSAERIPARGRAGSCTAAAYVPAMSDESVIVRNQGTIFLGGPPLVRAATGEVVSAEELGGGDLHARTSGVVDHLAEDEAHALRIARDLGVENLNTRKRRPRPGRARGPHYDLRSRTASCRRTTAPSMTRPRAAGPPRRRVAPASSSALYGTTLVCGFAHLHGYPVGVLANNGILFCERLKGAYHRAVLPAACRCCSCRTSPASWSARATRRRASPRTAPSSCRPWPPRRSPS